VVGSAEVLLCVRPAVVVVVFVCVVPDTVSVAIGRFVGILRECVIRVVDSIAIDILVQRVANSIRVRIRGCAVIIEGIGPAGVLDLVVEAVAIRIQIEYLHR